MDPSKIQRDIQSRHARQVGDAPIMGRVSRVYNSEVNSSSNSGGKGWSDDLSEAKSSKHRRLVLILSGCAAVLVLAVIGGIMALWLRSHGDGEKLATPFLTEKDMRIASKFVSPSEAEALALVRRSLAIRDSASVESCIRPGGATPEEIVKFMENLEKQDGRIDAIDWLGSMDVEGLLIDGVAISYVKDGETTARLAMLVPDEKGVWKVDFDAFARSSRPSWSDLIAGRVAGAEVRVLVAKDTYFNGPFQSEQDWVCYAMVSPDIKSPLPEDRDLLRGYCKKESPQAKAMESILSGETQINRATLRIQRHEGADQRQFEITRVLAQDWVMPPKPLDEKFR